MLLSKRTRWLNVIILPRPLLKLGFHLLYNQFSFSYDAVAWLVSLGRWPAWRRTVLPYLKNGPTLELAFGTGGLLLDMTRRNMAPFGLDLSPFMAQHTRRRFAGYGLQPHIAQAQAQAMPFPSAKFSNVVATFPTAYIFEPATLQEVKRLLLADGQLVVVLAGKLHQPRPLAQAIEWLYRLTGQSQPLPEDWLTPFQQAGFAPRLETATLADSSVWLIVAVPRAV